MLHYTRLERLDRNKQFRFLGPFIRSEENEVLLIRQLGRILNNSFSLQHMNMPNKLKRYILLGWRGLPGTNSLDF